MNSDIKTHIYFGSYTITDETQLLNSLETAYNYGYRRVDTATLYKNQHIVGQFINTPEPKYTHTTKSSDIKSYLNKRDTLWITSKVSFRVMPKGDLAIRKSIDKTLSDLQTHYIDLMLIHAPEKNDILTWKILCEYKKKRFN